ncbi:MAG: 50S ribosomal protein L9 [Planctomycetia bacterium]|nr:50S ribosomal protein L9 [Planctomycetia bacterium]
MLIEKNKRRRAGKRTGKRLPSGPNGGVQLLLVQTVDPLGKQGDVVEVRPGYAKNFLIPQGLATLATDHHRRMIEKHKAQLLEIQKQRLAGLQELADLIKTKSISIEANANAEGHLYGSIGPDEIVRALKVENIHITPDQVRLTGPLKELALYTVRIYLGHDIESELKVWVVPLAQEQEN